MVKRTFILFLCIGFSASLPATKLELVPDEVVQNDTTKVEVGTTHTGKVEVTLPYKILSKEELVSWVTYAMRLMASKINITLADTDPLHTPPEKIEKLRNSSEAINHFLEKVNKGEKKVAEKGKMKTVAMSSKHGTMCKHLEKQLEKLTSTTEKPTDSSANLHNQNYDFLTPPPRQKNVENSFTAPPRQNNVENLMSSPPRQNVENLLTKMISESHKFNPSLKLVQELALTNPYDHPDHKIFRDPNIFPPFNLQNQNSYLPLPVTPSYNEERLKEFYAMANVKNHTPPSFMGVMDPLSGLVMPMRTNFPPAPMHMPQLSRTEVDDLNSGMAFKQEINDIPHSSLKPILRVPFEAYITITQETSTLLPPGATPMPMTTSSRKPSTSSKYSQKNRFKDRDYSHEAATDNSPDTLIPNNRNRGSKNGKNISKTTIEFEDEVVTEKTVTDKKKKKSKKQSSKKQPSIFGTILRMFTMPRNTSTPSVSNIFGKISKKLPNPKVVKGNSRGKRNETRTMTSQRQGDDYGDEDSNGGNGNGDDDGNGNGNGNGNGDDDVRDLFEEDERLDGDYDYDEGGGSLGSLEDLLPLIIPILEDISDPESDTDLGEFLIAAIPLLQGLSEPDPETGEGIDIVGTLLPIFLNLSEGKDGMGSDSGAFLGPILQLIGPLIGPLSGPLIGPLSSSSSGGAKGSNLGTLLSALLGPLSTPTEPGGKSPIAILTANVVSILSKELSAPGSDVDVGKLVSQIVSGTLSGASAGLSGGSSKHISESKDQHQDGYGYGPDTSYGAPGPAAQGVELFEPPPPPAAQTFPRPPRMMRQPTKSTSRPSAQKKKTSSSHLVSNRFRPEVTHYRPQATHVDIVEIPDTFPIHPPVIIQKEQLAQPAHYGYGPVYGPPKPNAFEMLGKALKDILASGVNLVTAILGASTASSGASSQEASASSGSASGASSGSSHDEHPGYGYGPPPPQKYGPPPPQKYGPPKPYAKPDSYQNIRI